MLLSSFFLLIFILIYAFICRKDKISYLFSMYFICVAGLLVISVFYISKFTNYNYIISLDYNIYLFLSKARLSLSLISNLFDIFVVFYMFISILFDKVLNKCKFSKCLLMALPILLFRYINSYDVSWRLFEYANTGNTNNILNFLISHLGIFNEIMIAVYSLLPFLFISKAYRSTNFSFKKKYLLVVTFCTFLIISFIYVVIYKGLLSNFNYSNMELTKFPSTFNTIKGSIVVISLTFIIFTITGILTVYFKPFQELTFRKKQKHFNYSKTLNKNLKITLHTYKNAFVSVNKLAKLVETGLENNDKKMVDGSLDMLKELSEEHIQQLEYTLNTFLDDSIEFEPLNIIEILNATIKKAGLENIDINLLSDTEDTMIYGNKKHLIEAFLNLIYNASQALASKKIQDPKINISVYSLENYIIISIKDNGVGISKKELNHVFNLFYSKDPSQKGSGIGLYYVKNIVNMHRGYISVNSKEGVYTEFQIFLPALQKKKQSIFHGLKKVRR